MNRSFRASAEPQAAARGRILGNMTKDKGDDLALFLEMRKRDRERNDLLLLHNSDELDPPLGSRPGSSPLFKIVSSTPARRAANVDDFLNSDSEKNDYDWLLTPPGTPLFPSLETESNRSPIGHTGTSKNRPTVLKSRLANPADTSSRSNLVSSRQATSSGLNSYGVGTCRPSSSGGRSTASRPATPTGRVTSSATSKPSRPSTPTSRATLPSKPVVPPPRSLTPSARSSSLAPSRSSAPASMRSSAPASIRSSAPSSARSSTPTSRPSLSAPTKPASRLATPTRRPSVAPSCLPASSAPPGRSSSVTKSGPMISKSLVPSRGSSPTVRSRAWKPSDMPGFSLDAPPNLRTSMPERPLSASRGRPGAPSSRSSSVEPESIVRPRRQSCSPSRGRAPNGIVIHSGSSIPAVSSRSRLNGGETVSPVLIGSKMVERVVNVRRLAPPKQDDHQRSGNNSLTGKSSSSPDSTGFGRTLSRKSLDMALRHMDIRRSIPNNLRPLMTNIPASSMYSVRSGPARSRAVSVSDSPLATSSNASSEQSFSNNILCLDGGSEVEDDLCSDRGGIRSSPAGPRPR